MDSLFAPPGERWQPVSPRLRSLRRALLAFWLGVGGLAGGVAIGVLLNWWLAAGAVVVAAGAFAWGWWLVGRNWESWGYAERGDDLLVTHGVLFKTLVVVPYGRMQFVDVTAGPVERKFGIATVQLHTATPATDAEIPGLTPEEAERLRDRLAALGEARAAGL
ncbi:PH domain-containing protein [Actinopolymorpha alba]|uniref:PH domain-containing protein n=1 Tax=Actinopolymorpha alba TaxID=533267 RepID=UPI000685143E|nr:PH domain-containing protein [Actinopolymorpha alba]